MIYGRRGRLVVVKSTSTVVIVVININCGHHRCWHQLWSSSSLAVVVVVGVITTGALSTAPGLIGLPRLKHLTGYKSFMRALLLASGHHGVGSRSGGQLSNRKIDRGRSLRGRCAVVALVRSQRYWSRSRSKSMGLNKLKQ